MCKYLKIHSFIHSDSKPPNRTSTSDSKGEENRHDRGKKYF